MIARKSAIRMAVDLLVHSVHWQAHDLQSWADTSFALLDAAFALPKAAEVALLACDDAHIAMLNSDFRSKNTPTNVLSWPAYGIAPNANGHPPQITFDDSFLGDIAIAYETCLLEAQQQGKTLKNHVTHLCLHSMLHLLGYDHQTQAQAETMERLEISLLSRLDIANPY